MNYIEKNGEIYEQSKIEDVEDYRTNLVVRINELKESLIGIARAIEENRNIEAGMLSEQSELTQKLASLESIIPSPESSNEVVKE